MFGCNITLPRCLVPCCPKREVAEMVNAQEMVKVGVSAEANDVQIFEVEPSGKGVRVFRFGLPHSHQHSASSRPESTSTSDIQQQTGEDSGFPSEASSPRERVRRADHEGADLSKSIIGSHSISGNAVEDLQDDIFAQMDELSENATMEASMAVCNLQAVEEEKPGYGCGAPENHVDISSFDSGVSNAAGRPTLLEDTSQQFQRPPDKFSFEHHDIIALETAAVRDMHVRGQPFLPKIQIPLVREDGNGDDVDAFEESCGITLPYYQMDFGFGAPPSALPFTPRGDFNFLAAESRFNFNGRLIEDIVGNIKTLLLDPFHTQFHAVFVNVDAMNSIWLQLIERDRFNDFSELITHLNNYMRNSVERKTLLHRPERGDILLADIGGNVVRSKVLRSTYGKGNGMFVLLMDQGSCQEVSLHQLFPCPSKALQDLPALATRCKLDGVNYGYKVCDPKTDPLSELTTLLKNNDDVLDGHIVSGYLPSPHVTVDLHFKKDHVWGSRRFKKLGGNVTVDLTWRKGIHLIPPGERHVILTDLVSAGEFYCWTSSTASADLGKLDKDLKDRCRMSFGMECTMPEVGSLVIAKSQRSSRFYRCQVTAVNDDYTVKLASLDFGPNALPADIPMRLVKPMEPEDATLFPLALKCVVDGFSSSYLDPNANMDLAKNLLIPNGKRPAVVMIDVLKFCRGGEYNGSVLVTEDTAFVEIILEDTQGNRIEKNYLDVLREKQKEKEDLEAFREKPKPVFKREKTFGKSRF